MFLSEVKAVSKSCGELVVLLELQKAHAETHCEPAGVCGFVPGSQGAGLLSRVPLCPLPWTGLCGLVLTGCAVIVLGALACLRLACWVKVFTPKMAVCMGSDGVFMLCVV